ncbi:olfactory receptor 14I1-like [Sceloporus undulatus]|uniref:olfactory receptor 14I1-like n=1 Tax=Sceloporus undulatus TaxID=8520 RepID=UPI001C4D1FC9|nr:olfactory receptor 14I1-like [Sceloporus undulatus]
MKQEGSNTTTVTEFLLLELSDQFELQMLYFVLFLLIYLIALTGNLLLIMIVAVDRHLHTPMYLFLANLSILDIFFISVTIPKSINVSLTQIRSISFSGCMSQIFWGVNFASAELALLTVMAYDRYIAICFPLQYHVIMNKMKCAGMIAGCWISSTIYAMLHAMNIIFLPFCGPNNVDQLFCDIPQILKLACADTFGNETAVFACGIVFGLIFCSSIIVSYAHIFSAVQKIPSSHSRYKVFSTCLPHLIVFSLFLFTGMFTHMKRSSGSSISKELLAALLYSVVSPIANPVIYSLRNKEIRKALEKFMNKVIFNQHVLTTK